MLLANKFLREDMLSIKHGFYREKNKIGGVLSMNKTELIAAVAQKAELSKKDAEKALNAVTESVKEALAKGEKVQLVGFGTFEVKTRAARTGINPQTKQQIKIAASKAPVFKAGQGFKDAVK